MAPSEGTNPKTIDLTTPEYATKCGMCHPGGGPMEKDRNDNFLYKKSKGEIEAELNNGKIPGDYTIFSSEDKKFIPFEWKITVGDKTINNTMAPACFLCHSKLDLIKNHQGILNFRTAVSKLHYLSGADTAASGLATLNSTDKTFNYDVSLDVDNETNGIQIDSNVLGKANDQHCSQCHGGGWDQFTTDADSLLGEINPMDFVEQLKDLKFKQPDLFKEAKVWFFNETITDENGVPKNVEVHKWADYIGTENVKGCVDCHNPVDHELLEGYAPSFSIPSHDFAKGNAGPAHGVMWHQMAGTASCENCHKDPDEFHRSAFGPAASVHIGKIACTTCHIGKKYFYRLKLIDWSLPMWVVSGNATKITFKTLTKNGYVYGDPKNGIWPEAAWFPQRNPETGEVTWKLKSVNAMGVIYFEDNSTGEFKPVLARYLAKAFRVDLSLPTKYIIMKIDENGKPVREGDLGHLVLKVKKGAAIKDDEDLLSGNWVVIQAIPNYIDVNLNGKFDEGDLQITDDTGLSGKKDGTPEFNTREEIETAIETLKKAIGIDGVEVKLTLNSDAFAMTHNIRPAFEALKCGDCHGRSEDSLVGEFFTRKTPLYFPIDDVPGNLIDKKFERTPTVKEYAEAVREELINAGYPAPTEVTIESEIGKIEVKIKDSGAEIVATLDASTAAQQLNLPEEKVVAAVKVRATRRFQLEFDLKGLDASKVDVKTSKGSVVSKEVSGNTLIVTIDPTRADDEITVALFEREKAAIPGGGGGGGCSISPQAGFNLGGLLSSLLSLTPLVLLRRKKKH